MYVLCYHPVYRTQNSYIIREQLFPRNVGTSSFTSVSRNGGQALTSILARGEAVTRLPAVHATQSTASNNRNAACFRDQSGAARPALLRT